MDKKKLAQLIVTTAAFAFVTTPITSTIALAGSHKAPCYGVNSCKGKGACKTASNDCKGHNSCKGKGVMMMSKKSCEKKNGKTE